DGTPVVGRYPPLVRPEPAVRPLPPGDAAALAAVRRLVAEVEAADGRAPLGDDPLLALADGGRFVGLTVGAADRLLGYAPLAGPGHDGWELSVVVAPAARDGATADALVAAALAEVAARGGGRVHWWV